MSDTDYTINGWDAMAEACGILKKYGSENAPSPFHCEHDVLYVCDVDASKVSPDDLARLEVLGFLVTDEHHEPQLISFRFGSA